MNTGLRTAPVGAQSSPPPPPSEPPAAAERAPERAGARFQARALPARPGDAAGTLRLRVGRAELLVRAQGASPGADQRVVARVLQPARLPLVQVSAAPSAVAAALATAPAAATAPGAAPRVLARFPDGALLIDGGAGPAPVRPRVAATPASGARAGAAPPAVGQSVALALLEPGAPAEVELELLGPASPAPAAAAALPLAERSSSDDVGALLLRLAAGLRGRLAGGGAAPSSEPQLARLLGFLNSSARLPAGGAELLARLLPSLGPALGAFLGEPAGPLQRLAGRRAALLRALAGGAQDELSRAARELGERLAPEPRARAAAPEWGEPLIAHLPLPDAERPAWFALQPAPAGGRGGVQRVAFGVEFAHTGPVRVDALGLDGRFSITLRFADARAHAAAEREAEALRALLAATGHVQRLELLLDPLGATSAPGLLREPAAPPAPKLDRLA